LTSDRRVQWNTHDVYISSREHGICRRLKIYTTTGAEQVQQVNNRRTEDWTQDQPYNVKDTVMRTNRNVNNTIRWGLTGRSRYILLPGKGINVDVNEKVNIKIVKTSVVFRKLGNM
jgi:hypothetical protein